MRHEFMQSRVGLRAASWAFALLLGAAAKHLPAAQAGQSTPLAIRMDFIIGGKHAPWFVAWEKGFYSRRGLDVRVEPGSGSADVVRAIAAGSADVGFADLATAIVARSRGTPVVAVAQLGYVPTTILWREDTPIKTLKDLEGKSLAISPGQAQWYLMPAFCRINNINFKAIKIHETAPPLQPAALVANKADFIIMFRGSNDEVAEAAATKQGITLKRVRMRDHGLDIYGSSLIAREEDVKKRPEVVRAYVEATMEGLKYASQNRDEALQILLQHKPELARGLSRLQLENALSEVFIPRESLDSGFGYMRPAVMEKTVKLTNEFFDVARKVAPDEVYTNRFIRK